MERVFPDTNVLFPMSLMDMVLTLDRVEAHRFVWSETLLAEWRRVVLRSRPESTPRVESVLTAIRTAFAATRVPEEAFAELVPTLSGPDPDDIMHMAAAIVGRATVLATNNLRDFPASTLAPHGVTVMNADRCLCSIAAEVPTLVVEALTAISARKTRPPMPVPIIVKALDGAGVPEFADRAFTLWEETRG
jgi:predicted nucleic acid-binding protein